MTIKLLSSSGGSVTLDVPVTASNYNLTVPAASGTAMVSGNMPAFSAGMTAGSQSLGANTLVKVQFNSIQFDTASCFDATTNYRFTPNVAGYYQVNCSSTLADATNQTTNLLLLLYKNGSSYAYIRSLSVSGNYTFGTFSYVVYMNGTTDYLEVYAEAISNNGVIYGSGLSIFSAALVRAA